MADISVVTIFSERRAESYRLAGKMGETAPPSAPSRRSVARHDRPADPHTLSAELGWTGPGRSSTIGTRRRAPAARQAHNLEVGGSIPPDAIESRRPPGRVPCGRSRYERDIAPGPHLPRSRWPKPTSRRQPTRPGKIPAHPESPPGRFETGGAPSDLTTRGWRRRPGPTMRKPASERGGDRPAGRPGKARIDGWSRV